MSQYVEDEILWLITYFSAKHNFQKCNYEIYDKKLLIIIKILKEWHSELQDVKKKFEIITNHKNFQHFMITKLLNQKQIKWSKFLSRFNFRIIYCLNKLTNKSDTLFQKTEDKLLFKTDCSNDWINHCYQQVLKKSNISSDMIFSLLLFQNNKNASVSSLLLFRNNIVSSSADIFSLQLYVLNMKMSINDLISVCYDNNKNIQDMLIALKDNFIQQWFQFLRKKLQIIMLKCKIIKNQIYYCAHLLVSEEIFLRLHIMMRTHSFTADDYVDYRKMIDLIKKFYIWYSMTKNID